ncbi:unnamed protein product [Fraxinus pennsylvanica]|uniref:Exostosin GT47 domain-containing protein n=1 Tax=Fraxinus pennsylvanica TaxID=56036 RepID=A0AAD1ZKY8_9LAMI|nr:unnamed protein product [Fraxinus pennsylvanica]
MEKRFKVWVYNEGEPPLFHRGPLKDIYAIEGHFIDKLENGKSPFLVRHPDEAHTVFIPVGIAKIIRYLYTPRLDYDRWCLQSVVTDYISVISNRYPYWNRSAGADHFFVGCHDWDQMFQLPVLSCIKTLSECYAMPILQGFQPARDVSLPEIKVPSKALGPPDVRQASTNHRPIFAFFAGGPHGGWEVASPRLIESMHAGCVPMIISNGYVLPFSDVLDWSKFYVHIPVARIPEIKTILEGISIDDYLKM